MALADVELGDLVGGILRFAHGHNWLAVSIGLLLGASVVAGGVAGTRKILGRRIPWLHTQRGAIVLAAAFGGLESVFLALLYGVPPKVAFTLGLNSALTASGGRDWWRKALSPHSHDEAPTTKESTP